MPAVFIPTSLRRLSGGIGRVDLQAGTVAGIVRDLERRFPGMQEALVEGESLRPGVVASVNGEQTSWLLAAVPEGAELHFVLAISGG